jgi:N-acetylglucosamine kinase-like BadF-type ATPase
MILIADSGSTKCDWAHLSNGGQIKKFQTLGLNPQVQTKSFLENLITSCPDFDQIEEKVEEAYLYVSGCSTNEHQHIIEDILKARLPNVRLIEVHNDLQGAARACLGDQQGLVAILGTGSNLAWFDGENLDFKTPALGYVLGDEGSGNHLGKRLIVSYLYGQMPSDLSEMFTKYFNMDKAELLNKVYQGDRPNAFLASWAPFLADNQDHPFAAKIISECFDSFIRNHVLAYPKNQRSEVNFVGSIPFFLKEPLSNALMAHDIKLGECLPKPIDQLIKYHTP